MTVLLVLGLLTLVVWLALSYTGATPPPYMSQAERRHRLRRIVEKAIDIRERER